MKLAYVLVLVSATCSLLSCKTPTSVIEEPQHGRDFIRLDPTSPRLSYIKVDTVEESEGVPVVELTGKVGFDEDHTQRVASPFDGRVTKILVQLGDRVKKDQSLIELSSARAAELEAEAQKADQDLAVAEKARTRAEKLKQEGAISDKESAQVDADYQKAKADAARAGAQLRSLALSAVGPTVTASLRAQVPGLIVERNIFVGQEVRADATGPLLTISDLGTVWVLGDLYEQDLALASQGASVDVRVPAYPGEAFPGRIDHVGDVLDPVTHTVKLRCIVPNPSARLKPEMFAKIRLSDEPHRKVIQVPTQAVLLDSEHARVIVATEGNVFRQRVVQIGPEVDGKVRVVEGLKPGERIVTEGAIFLRREMQAN